MPSRNASACCWPSPSRTTARFPRRLIAERRIRFVRVGRHVRIPESELQGFIDEGTVERLRLYPAGSG
ncbi:excisionase family DNA-binding protein [Terrabacter sp. Soil810]|uniref:excisionase family DNA-binding protein n=1 Tax=Terrabacter sp. Soil810 TaxID=1736418 RepID=UPI0009EBFC88|nr:excisionase family DNA-binding protein [Terrabacter sp. Soil810]